MNVADSTMVGENNLENILERKGKQKRTDRRAHCKEEGVCVPQETS